MNDIRIRRLSGALALALATSCTVGGTPPPVGVDGGHDGASVVFDDSGLGADRAPCTPESTAGHACTSDAECDDGCFCNGRERCAGGSCAEGTAPCRAPAAACAESACDETAQQCMVQEHDEACDDGDACNGAEECSSVFGCVAGAIPSCDDGDVCTVDSCAPASGCAHVSRDIDGDGVTPVMCGGEDCDDYDPDRHPGVAEVCGDGIDQDCDRVVDNGCELDGNDTCASAYELPSPGSYLATTEGMSPDYRTSFACAPAMTFPGPPDAVFRYVLAERSDVRVDAAGGALVVQPLAECGGASLGCGWDEVVLASAAPGAYAILVRPDREGRYEIDLSVSVPVCGDAAIDASDGGSFSGSFSDDRHVVTLPCHSDAYYREHALRLDIAAPSRVVLQASGTTAAGVVAAPALAITTDCGDATAAYGCDPGSSAAAPIPMTTLTRDLSPGRYYVIVEQTDLRLLRDDPPQPLATWDLDVVVSPL